MDGLKDGWTDGWMDVLEDSFTYTLPLVYTWSLQLKKLPVHY